MNRIPLIIITALALITASCGSKKNQEKAIQSAAGPTLSMPPASQVKQVTGIGLIEPETLISDLAAPSSGIVTNVLKNSGDHVKKGELLVQFDNTDELLSLEKIRQQIVTAGYAIASAQAAVSDQQIQLSAARKKLETSRSLVKTGGETAENVRDLENDAAGKQALLHQKEADLSSARSQLQELNVALKQAQSDLDKKQVSAPADGIVLEMMAVPNSAISQYQTVASFAPAGPMIARCEVDEMFAPYVKPGQSVVFRNVGYTRAIATGTVISTSPYLKPKSLFVESSTDQQDRRVREVRIRLNDEPDLYYNARVECVIDTQNSRP